MSVTMSLFFLLGFYFSSFVSQACSLPEGASIPNCPIGERFDLAVTCQCVSANLIKSQFEVRKGVNVDSKPIQRPLECGKVLPSWLECSEDADCISHKGVCSLDEAYSKKFLNEIDFVNQCLGQKTPCPILDKDAVKVKKNAVCRSKKCTLSLQNSLSGDRFTIPKEQLEKVEALNSCKKDEDCILTGYSPGNYWCEALCSPGTIYINRTNLQVFEATMKLLRGGNEKNCPTTKCAPYSWDIKLVCSNQKCVSK